MLGRFAVSVDGAPVPGLGQRDAAKVLAFLALHAGQDVAYRTLAERFWPAEARRGGEGGDFPSVRQSMRALRAALGEAAPRLLSVPGKGLVCLEPSQVCCDWMAVEARLRSERDDDQEEGIDTAFALGHLLPAWNEPWVESARRRLLGALQTAVHRQAVRAEAAGLPTTAALWRRQWARYADGHATPAPKVGGEIERADVVVVAADGTAHRRCALRLERDLAALGFAIQEPAVRPDRLPPAVVVVADPSQWNTPAVLDRIGGGTSPERRWILAAEDRAAAPTPHVVVTPRSADAVAAALRPEPSRDVVLEPEGGAVGLGSPFYVEREADHLLRDAVGADHSIVLLRGSRQTGKSSLLLRGALAARSRGADVVVTDLGTFHASEFEDSQALTQALGSALAVPLGVAPLPGDDWRMSLSPNTNLDLYLRRRILAPRERKLVWMIDDVDRLLHCRSGHEVLGLFRSWHNQRALDPQGPWARLTLVLTYATEAHLLITDQNQSPFNVGYRLSLHDFSRSDTDDLCGRYGVALTSDERDRLHALLLGHPLLTRLALHHLLQQRATLAELESVSHSVDGPFGEHFRHVIRRVARDPELVAAVRRLLAGDVAWELETFFRLRSAGVLRGDGASSAEFRCPLYRTWFARYLPPGD